MFFVGATGQLITLVLTVCLPFVFFVYGNKKVELSENTQLKFQHEQVSVETIEIESIDFNNCFYDEPIGKKLNTDIGPPIKIPPQFVFLRSQFYSLTSSGNKAPPTEISFKC